MGAAELRRAEHGMYPYRCCRRETTYFGFLFLFE
jgi:hypothetical protein